MDFDRRKRLIAIVAMAAVMSAVIQSYAISISGTEKPLGMFEKLFYSFKETFAYENYEGIIRFHVKANSNSEEDQQLKLKVRDAVLEEVNAILEEETVKRYDAGNADYIGHRSKSGKKERAKLTLSETREVILENMELIEDAAKNVIAENGYIYGVSAELGNTFIPEKTYGDVTFPAGNYEALTMTIGEGKGDNWWCVLFPPLCIIDPSGSSLDSIEIEDVEKDMPFGTAEKGVVLKFKTLEMLDRAAN